VLLSTTPSPLAVGGDGNPVLSSVCSFPEVKDKDPMILIDVPAFP
jgi:hypothetical protein